MEAYKGATAWTSKSALILILLLVTGIASSILLTPDSAFSAPLSSAQTSTVEPTSTPTPAPSEPSIPLPQTATETSVTLDATQFAQLWTVCLFALFTFGYLMAVRL